MSDSIITIPHRLPFFLLSPLSLSAFPGHSNLLNVWLAFSKSSFETFSLFDVFVRAHFEKLPLTFSTVQKLRAVFLNLASPQQYSRSTEFSHVCSKSLTYRSYFICLASNVRTDNGSAFTFKVC